MEKLLYSKDEAAQIVGLSRHTITRDIKLGRIAVKHYGRRCLIPKDEILRIAKDGMQPDLKPAA